MQLWSIKIIFKGFIPLAFPQTHAVKHSMLCILKNTKGTMFGMSINILHKRRLSDTNFQKVQITKWFEIQSYPIKTNVWFPATPLWQLHAYSLIFTLQVLKPYRQTHGYTVLTQSIKPRQPTHVGVNIFYMKPHTLMTIVNSKLFYIDTLLVCSANCENTMTDTRRTSVVCVETAELLLY